ncbi:MAG: winged helix-turn-helix transcriptional regulator [Phycisphaerales bacterium]|nr:winged helix-turn-helix transcriptional regulator [Phycisphaerales bacterium]
MTQTSKHRAPATPRAAARARRPVDGLLDPAFFKALADPTRLLLFACLAKCARPCSVSDVAACCNVDFSVVSRHLGTLAAAGLLTPEKRGKHMFYSVRFNDLSLRLRALADAIDQCGPGCCPPAACGCGAPESAPDRPPEPAARRPRAHA